jgi:hypothetical protein
VLLIGSLSSVRCPSHHDISESAKPVIRTFLEEYDCSFWFSYLQFAIKWGFKPQEELAMDRLKKLDKPAFVIAASRLRGLGAEFLAPYFAEMFNQAPTFEDGEALGLNDLVLLCQMQNHYKARCADNPALDVLYAQAVLEGVKAGDSRAFAVWRLNKKRRDGIGSPISSHARRRTLDPGMVQTRNRY